MADVAASSAGQDVVGRQREWALLSGLLATVDEESVADGSVPERRVVVRGPAGIGKTHLLRAAVAEARRRGFRIGRCAGHQRDRDAPLGALEELLGAEFAEFAASDLAPADPEDHLPAAMQALRIVLSWTMDGPVLLVVDDAQWVDRASWESLLFVLRRIQDDPVVVLIAVTSGTVGDERLEGAGLPTLTLEPLPTEDAQHLLTRTVPDLPSDVAAVVLRASAGLPLALVELGTAAGRDGGEAVQGSIPVTDRLEQAYARALASLPETAALALRVFSVGEGTSAGEVLRASGCYLSREVQLTDLQPAIDARLLELSVDGFEIWFASPTARAVVSALTPAAERHLMHLAWASALTTDPDRALWHRAAGTLGPDAALEADLMALAERAVKRNDLDVASAAAEQAARFASDPQDAAHLQLQAARYAIDVDDGERCRRLVATVNPHALSPVDRASLRWLTSMLRPGWSGADTLTDFVDSARQMHEAGADRLALDALMGVGLRFHFTNPAAEVRTSAVELLDELDLPADADVLRVGGLGIIAPAARGGQVLKRIADISPSTVSAPETLFTLGVSALGVGDPASAKMFLTAAEGRCRAAGRLGTLARTLITFSFAAALVGQTGQARAYGTEGRRLAGETNQPRWVVTADLALSYTAALRGDADDALELAAGVEAALNAVGLFPLLSHVELTRGIVAASTGDHPGAVAHLARPFREDDPSFHPQVRFWGLSHLAFAALRTGDADVLDEAMAAATDERSRVPSPLLTMSLSFVNALTASDADTPAAFELALTGRTGEPAQPTNWADWPFDRARLQLNYGSWLRRHQQYDQARPHLEAAGAAFAALGTRPWAHSARAEMEAAGGTGGPTVSVVDALSPQELQVAQLVSEGLTNRQVAERLFVSPRTIESHLYRIYAKVGAANRTDLARLLNLGASTG